MSGEFRDFAWAPHRRGDGVRRAYLSEELSGSISAQGRDVFFLKKKHRVFSWNIK